MPRLLRIFGALIAIVATGGYVFSAWPALILARPFFDAIVVPVISGTLVLIVLSYILAFCIDRLNQTNPSTPFAFVCSAIYLLVCTVVVVLFLARALFFIVLLNVTVLIGGLALLLFLIPYSVVVLIVYILAATWAPIQAGVEKPRECFCRGILIGMNAGMNAALGFLFYSLLFAVPVLSPWPQLIPEPIGVYGGIGLAALLMLATLQTTLASATLPPALPFSNTTQYCIEAFAGWFSWLMPMSWIDCAAGWALFYINWIGHWLSALAPDVFTPDGWSIRAVRLIGDVGVIPTDGGIAWPIGNIVPGTAPWDIPLEPEGNEAFSEGCFSFISPASPTAGYARQHETGHHLSLAALGFFFSTIAGMNETGFGPIGGQGLHAYSERIAESNVDSSHSGLEVQVWK
jgi:hypothetical protein